MKKLKLKSLKYYAYYMYSIVTVPKFKPFWNEDIQKISNKLFLPTEKNGSKANFILT